MTDPVLQDVILNLVEHFADLDDSEDAPFGEYARVSWAASDGEVWVRHEEDPWGIHIKIERFSDGPQC